MYLKNLAVGAALAVGIAAATPAFAVNLVVNGDFETPTTTAGGFTNFGAGSSGLTGWTVLGPRSGAVSLFNTTYSEAGVNLEAQSGQNSLDLTGSDNQGPTDGVSQDLHTVAGKIYVLKFWVGNASGNNNFTLPSSLGLSFDGRDAFPFTNDAVTARGVNWREFAITFRASAPVTNIAFRNKTAAGDSFTGLDNVSVAGLVPEPATWTMMIAGFGLVGAALRRRPRTFAAA